MLLGMSEHLGLPVSQAASFWLQLLLTTPVQFWAGWQFYKGAWAVARHGTTDMNTLIALGTTAAFGNRVAERIHRCRCRASCVLRLIRGDHHAHSSGPCPRSPGQGADVRGHGPEE